MSFCWEEPQALQNESSLAFLYLHKCRCRFEPPSFLHWLYWTDRQPELDSCDITIGFPSSFDPPWNSEQDLLCMQLLWTAYPLGRKFLLRRDHCCVPSLARWDSVPLQCRWNVCYALTPKLRRNQCCHLEDRHRKLEKDSSEANPRNMAPLGSPQQRGGRLL